MYLIKGTVFDREYSTISLLFGIFFPILLTAWIGDKLFGDKLKNRETKKTQLAPEKNDTFKVKKNSTDNLSLTRNVLNDIVKNFSPHLDQLRNESDEMINNIFTISGVVSENLETQLHDSGSSTQPLLVKLDKNVYNKRLENLYSRGYILGLCTIVGHPKNNEYLCLDKKPDKIEDKNKLFIYMTLIIHLKIFGKKAFSILEKSQLDSDSGKPMFDKGVKDSLQDSKESAESGFTKNPKRLFNYLMKKN